ncbi:MAG: hypothetical protein ACLFM1_11105 [Bacteroidales bacterium]
MKNRTFISRKDLKYHKSSSYKHNIKLLENAYQSVLTDEMYLTNSGNMTAGKVVLLMMLGIKPERSDVEILESSHPYNLNVYPNGFLQICFQDISLAPGEYIRIAYRIRTGKTDLPRDKIITNNYLFFCF